MGIKEYKLAKDLIEQDGSGDFEDEKPISLIEKAEKFLDVTFPASYKEFLIELGCGDIGGIEFYGIIDDNFIESSIPDGIWLTYDERKSSGLDLDLVLIGQSIEGFYALDLSRMNEFQECPVIDWHAGLNKEDAEIIAEDFGVFILNEVKEVL